MLCDYGIVQFFPGECFVFAGKLELNHRQVRSQIGVAYRFGKIHRFLDDGDGLVESVRFTLTPGIPLIKGDDVVDIVVGNLVHLILSESICGIEKPFGSDLRTGPAQELAGLRKSLAEVPGSSRKLQNPLLDKGVFLENNIPFMITNPPYYSFGFWRTYLQNKKSAV